MKFFKRKPKPKRLSNEDFNAIYGLLREDKHTPIVKYNDKKDARE